MVSNDELRKNNQKTENSVLTVNDLLVSVNNI